MKKGHRFHCGWAIVPLVFCACDGASEQAYSFEKRQQALTSEEEVGEFALQAQALLGGYDSASVNDVTRHIHHLDRESFVSSKPSVNSDGMEIHSYRPSLRERGLEYDSILYKLLHPSAIDDELSLPKTGRRVPSEKILELAFRKARDLVPEAAQAVDAAGYSFSFAQRNTKMGSSWLPSKLTLELQEDKRLYLNTPTLISNKNIPVVGGMNYCKVFVPTQAARILVDLAQGDHDRIPFHKPGKAPLELAAGPMHTATSVNWFGVGQDFLAQKALLFVDKRYQSSGQYRGTVIISPGGFIPSISMRGLAKKIASTGYIVFVNEYPSDAAFWEVFDPRKFSYLNLAGLIKQQATDKIRGLLPSVESYYAHTSSAIVILGHSLGGAVTGPVVFGDDNPFDHIILSGVASFVKAPGKKKATAENVSLFFGSNETTTAKKKDIDQVLEALSINTEPDSDGIYRSDTGNRSMEFIEGLNHFCIVSDMNVGLNMVKDSDGPGPAPSVAVQMMVEHLKNRGLL